MSRRTEADPALPTAAVLDALVAWAESGVLRWLDVALARFLAAHDDAGDPASLVVAAWVARAEGLGHSCIAVDAMRDEIGEALREHPEVAARTRTVTRALPERTADWLRVLTGSRCVQRAGELLDAQAPLVLEGPASRPRLYLRRYWQYERDVAERLADRAATDAEVGDRGAIHAALELLFPPREASRTDWQKVATSLAMRRRLTVVTGGPGTGKTFVAARVLAASFLVATDPSTLRVRLAAPTGKAAARLKQAIDQALALLATRLAPEVSAALSRLGSATTLHALLGSRPDRRRRRHDAANPLDVDLLIVDEASMINLEMMAGLLDALPSHARLVLIGDRDQLASVEAGAVLADLCGASPARGPDDEAASWIDAVAGISLAPDPASGPPIAQQVVALRDSHRFDQVIASLAAAVNAGDVAGAVQVLDDPTQVSARWVTDATPASIVDLALGDDGFGPWLAQVEAGPEDRSEAAHRAWVDAVLIAFDRCRVLSALRSGPWGASGLNAAIESRLAATGHVPATRTWYVGRPAMVTRNDYGLKVFNGDVGIALPAIDGSLRVYFGVGEQARDIGVARLAEVETAFAMTVHKSQGSEFDHALLVVPPDAGRVATRELLYTGITRARRAVTLLCGDPAALAHAIERRTVRASGLAGRLGWPAA